MKKNKINKKKVVMLTGFFFLFTILLSFFSLAYYTNIGKWLDEQKNPYVNGEGQKRLAEDFIEDGCGIGTMLDTVTSLCWDKNLVRFGSKNWSNAFNDCNNLNHAGYSDWRLPQRDELMTLVDLIGSSGTTCSTLNSFGFTSCANSYYWGSTVSQADMSSAWSVYFAYGNSVALLKTNNNYFVCVR